MDRFGIFVDAGFLFAASGELCLGTRDRRRLVLDHVATTEGLADVCERHCKLGHLRTYWYDGAREAHPTAQQQAIGKLPGVKIRLGRLTKGRQKGVDSRIVRDLIILSQERAISVAYLLGGDEDLREGVSEAQERGVRVVLLSIPLARPNLSPPLAMEADAIVPLGRDFFDSKIGLIPEEPHLEVPVAPPVPAPVGGLPAPIDIGREFGFQWREATPPEAVAMVRARRPSIPQEIDRPLLRHGTARLARGHLEDDERKAIRDGFWEAVDIAEEA